jgi:peptide/histidine transporter 3/4
MPKLDELESPLVEEAERRPSVLSGVASYIIATEFCERLAYYGFAGSLVLFFQTQLDYSNEDAVNAFYLWNGAVYVTPLLGGYIADTYLGRYKTILVFALIYLFGLALFLFGSVPGHITAGLVFSGMYMVALGAGGMACLFLRSLVGPPLNIRFLAGIKPNCSTMGADQFDMKIDQDKAESKYFFSYFYW